MPYMRLTPEQKQLRALARRLGGKTMLALHYARNPVYEDDFTAWTDQAVRYARQAWRAALTAVRWFEE